MRLKVLHQRRHNSLSQALTLMFWQNSDINNLKVAAPVTDNSSHPYGLILVKDLYTKPGIRQG